MSTALQVAAELSEEQSSLPAALPIKTTSSIHSSLRVVTNPGELTAMPPLGKWTPSHLRSPTSLLLSPLGHKPIKGEPDNSAASSNSTSLLEAASKDLQFDPRFLAEAWSQESPQSVYGPLGQSLLGFSGFTGFSPLAASSPGGARLLSPMAAHFHASSSSSSSSSSQHPQSFTSHLQGPLLAMSPSGFYPPSVVIPASPHQLNPHLLSPLFASAISPGGGLGVSQEMLSTLIDPSTVFVPPSSPSAILRHLLPPIQPQSGPLNVKDLTLNELRPHFNKPMALVAKELGVCITLMKKICRRNGLVRWPHRRIRSLVNRITSLQVIAGNATGAEKKRVQAQISNLREELSSVIENPNEKSRKAQADAKARSPTAAVRGRGGTTTFSTTIHSDDDDEGEEGEEEGDEGEAENHAQNENVAPQQATVSASALRRAEKRQPPPRKTKAAAASRGPATGKRKERFRVPPPIKIPRRTEAADDGRPSSTTSTGSGKRGSISSILC